MPNNSILQIERGTRTAVIGQSGTGKTTLVEVITTPFERDSIIVLDPKGEFNLPFYSESQNNKLSYDTPEKLARAKTLHRIYRPSRSLISDADAWEQILGFVYDRKNTVLIADEVYALGNGMSFPNTLRAICTRGRSRGITAIWQSQRPKRVPQEIFSESLNIYLFRVALEADRKHVAGMTHPDLGKKLEGPGYNGHEFFHYQMGQTEPPKVYRLPEG